jgi:outer membrane protein TolC
VQNARQEQALLQYEKDILTALEEVENALSAHTRERSREASLKAAVDSTRRALALATDRYTSGLEDFLSVLDAERSVYAAEDQLVRSEKTTAVTLIAVYKALGGGWSPRFRPRSWLGGGVGSLESLPRSRYGPIRQPW